MSAEAPVQVYDKVEQVPVPQDVPPGSPFSVQWWAKRAGQRVAIPKRLWRASSAAPAVQQRVVAEVGGKRAASRPSARATQATGKKGAKAIDNIEEFTDALDLTLQQVEMPLEAAESDVGWLPGPVGGAAGRVFPTFRGPAFGPTKRDTRNATARAIVEATFLTPEYKKAVVDRLKLHVQWWRRMHPKLDGIERSFPVENVTADHIDLWHAARVRLARLNTSVPAELLWKRTAYGRKNSLYDEELDAALPYMVYQFLNRHISFGDYGGECPACEGAEDDSEGSEDEADDEAQPQMDEPLDAYRKRRACSDIMRKAPPKAFNPSQHLSFDDTVREDRLGKRIRFKASVHTGALCDALTCCRSNYFLHWEERGWHQPEQATADSATAGGDHAHGRNETTTGRGGRGRGRSQGRAGRGRGGGRGSGGRGSGGGSGSGGGHSAPAAGRDGSARGAAASGAGARGGAAAVDASNEAAGGAAVDAVEDDGDEPDELKEMGARLLRSLKAAGLKPKAGYIVWLDQGVSTMEALLAAHNAGFGVCAIVTKTRVGLPRNYLKWLEQQLKCPRACTHAAACTTCNRWRWVVLHKGVWELTARMDAGGLIVTVSNCASATRQVDNYRVVAKTTVVVRVPEANGKYNLFGRHGTDTGDQHRKRLRLAARRQERQGAKGALFDAELGFVDAAVYRACARGTTKIDVMAIANEWASDVLQAVSMRRQQSTAAAAAAESETQGPAATRAQAQAHKPIWFADVRKRARRAGPSDVELPAAKRGRSCCRACAGACRAGEPKHPSIFCPGCARGRKCSGWFHWGCYWDAHRAVAL